LHMCRCLQQNKIHPVRILFHCSICSFLFYMCSRHNRWSPMQRDVGGNNTYPYTLTSSVKWLQRNRTVTADSSIALNQSSRLIQHKKSTKFAEVLLRCQKGQIWPPWYEYMMVLQTARHIIHHFGDRLHSQSIVSYQQMIIINTYTQLTVRKSSILVTTPIAISLLSDCVSGHGYTVP